MKHLSFFLALVFITISCNSGTRQTKEQITEGEKWDAVMANHDVVMPMMSTTHKIRKSLKNYLNTQESAEATLVSQAAQLVTNLDKADESMMDWMQGYQKLGELQGTKSHEEIMQYLAQEDKKIAKVKELFDTSIKEGETFLKNINQE